MEHLIQAHEFREFLEDMEKTICHEERERKLWDIVLAAKNQTAINSWLEEVKDGVK